MNVDETEDATLAQEAQSHLAIQDKATATSKSNKPPAKRSLSALAAASRKPASGSASSLSALAAARAQSNSTTNGKPSLSKLAAKSQAAADAPARRPLGSFASRADTTEDKPKDVEMQGVKVEPSAAQASKLSKLQQRIQRGGAFSEQHAAPPAHNAKEDEEKLKKDTWQLPSSSLFPTNIHLASAPSVFAGTLVPEHPYSAGPEPAAITEEAIKAGHNKLPKLNSSVGQQKPLHKLAGRSR